MVSVIVPTLNEAARIAALVTALRELDGAAEVIVADGGSDDGTAEHAAAAGARVMAAPRGRGQQMHAAALAARGDVLWFVHADSRPARCALQAMRAALRDPAVAAGNFALVFEGETAAARRLTWIYPRLRWLGLAYGDAGIFVRRTVYESLGGFRPYPLFEDVDLVRRLRRHGRFVHLDCPLTTSMRRLQGQSEARMWAHWIALQSLYWLGVAPDRLARWYGLVR